MQRNSNQIRTAVIAALLGLTTTHVATAQQSTGAPVSGDLEQIIVTGTRVANRSALETAVPVDVVSSEALENLGVTEVNQALSVALPSFNFPRPGLADGTDTIRPATLRGLAPDQTLVLRQRQAAPRGLARQRQRHDRARRGGGRSQHDSERDRAIHRSAARRRLGAVRLGRDRRRHQPAPARRHATAATSTLTYGWRESSYDTPTGTVAAPARPGPHPPSIERDVSDGETLTVRPGRACRSANPAS